METTDIKIRKVGIHKSFLEKIVAKYPTWNSFIKGMKDELKIGMFLDSPLDEDVPFETELFDYHYFETEKDSGSREMVEYVKSSLLTKSQAFTILANQIYLFKKATYATQIKYDDRPAGFLGVQEGSPCAVYYVEHGHGTVAMIAIRTFGSIHGGVGPNHYRFDRYWGASDALNKNHSVHLTTGSVIFCK